MGRNATGRCGSRTLPMGASATTPLILIRVLPVPASMRVYGPTAFPLGLLAASDSLTIATSVSGVSTESDSY